MTAIVGSTACGDAESHEWVLRSVDFEDWGAISAYECLLCGTVDYREGSAP